MTAIILFCDLLNMMVPCKPDVHRQNFQQSKKYKLRSQNLLHGTHFYNKNLQLKITLFV